MDNVEKHSLPSLSSARVEMLSYLHPCMFSLCQLVTCLLGDGVCPRLQHLEEIKCVCAALSPDLSKAGSSTGHQPRAPVLRRTLSQNLDSLTVYSNLGSSDAYS